jgi:hypothetical protein
MSRITHCLGNRLSAGGEVVSLTHLPCFIPPKQFSASVNLFCYRVSKSQSLVRSEVVGKWLTFNYTIRSRTRVLLARSIVPEPLSYRESSCIC